MNPASAYLTNVYPNTLNLTKLAPAGPYKIIDAIITTMKSYLFGT